MRLSRIFKWLCPLALVVVAFAAVRADSPEDVVKAFIDAWNGKELKKAAGLVVGGKPDANFSGLQDRAIGTDWPKITILSSSSDSKGDKATVALKYTMEAQGFPKEENTEQVELVKVDENWLIVPLTTSASLEEKRYLGMMAGLLTNPEMFNRAKEAAKKTACLSNVKQLALGIMILAADNDDVIKIDLSRAKKTLNPYLKNDNLWYCPEGPKDKVAYTINPKVVNIPMTKIQDPANTVLVYEGSKGQLDFRHQGKASVAYADGHARSIDAAAAKKLRWNP